MELFLHSTNGIEIITVGGSTRVRDVVAAHSDKGSDLWVENGNAPLGTGRKIVDVASEHSHLHISACRKVTVAVRYNGTEDQSFSPADTIQKVFDWATGEKAFGLTPAEQAKHELSVSGSDAVAERATHVGTLAAACSLNLDLAPAERFQG